MLGTWQMLVRYYFPASSAPSPPDDGRPKLTPAGEDPAVA